MTRTQREKRLDALLTESHQILERSIQTHVLDAGRTVAGVVILFSGGNDSTVLGHVFRKHATHTAHANTTVGIEATRDYVRATSKLWGLPLIEKMPPRLEDRYRALVLNKGYSKTGDPLGGFPGPGMHWKMWNRLKERALEAVQAELVLNPYKQRVVFVAGRRRAESQRRARIPANGQRRSKVWSSPMIHWTRPDMNTYRLRERDSDEPVPVNETANLMHMSGECLCGAYASAGEREQVDYWYPMALEEVRELEAILQTPEYAHIPPHRRVWGWAAIPELVAQAAQWETVHKSGGLCENCGPTLF